MLDCYYSEVRLHKMMIALKEELSEHVLDPRVDFDFVSALSSNFIASIKGFVWSTAEEKVVAKYPANTWQMFKSNWFPTWLQDRFPVKYTEIVCHADALFPTLREMIPDHEAILHLKIMNNQID